MMCAMVDDVELLCLVKERRKLEVHINFYRWYAWWQMSVWCYQRAGSCGEVWAVPIAQVGLGQDYGMVWWILDHDKSGLHNLSRVLSAHGRGGKPRLHYEVEDLDGSLLAHLIESHKEEPMSYWKLEANQLPVQVLELLSCSVGRLSMTFELLGWTIVLATLDSRWYEQNNASIEDHPSLPIQKLMNEQRNLVEPHIYMWQCFPSWLRNTSL
jgi:hypothetical protein